MRPAHRRQRRPPEITAAPEAAAAPEVTDAPEATATPDLSQVKAFLVVTVGDKTYQPIPLTEEGYYRLRHGDCINIVHVTPTSIDMHEANCDNQDCVEQGEVTLENKDTRIFGQQDYLSAESGDAPAVQPRRIDGLADDRAGGRSK